MRDANWCLGEGDIRRLRLLEHLTGLGSGIHNLAGFYGHDQSRATEARGDVRYLDELGHVGASVGMGGIQGVSASITPSGAHHLERLRAARGGRSRRAWACRAAMLSWLYEQEAVGSHDQSVTWELFLNDARCLYYGQSFRPDERDTAAAWLQRKGLIDGVGTEESNGPVRSFVTDEGERCAERFDCDVKAYVDAMEQPARNNVTTWNVTGEQVQIATGGRSQQHMTLGPTSDQIKLGLQGVVELLQSLNLDPSVQDRARALAGEAVADLESEDPTGEPARRFLEWVKDSVREGGTGAVVAAITAMSSGLLQDVERLVSTIGG